MLVHSSKAEHHRGDETRLVPILPELRPFLDEVFSPNGSEFAIESSRNEAKNFRTRLERILKRAGLKPWPKLFQNLRC